MQFLTKFCSSEAPNLTVTDVYDLIFCSMKGNRWETRIASSGLFPWLCLFHAWILETLAPQEPQFSWACWVIKLNHWWVPIKIRQGDYVHSDKAPSVSVVLCHLSRASSRHTWNREALQAGAARKGSKIYRPVPYFCQGTKHPHPAPIPAPAIPRGEQQYCPTGHILLAPVGPASLDLQESLLRPLFWLVSCLSCRRSSQTFAWLQLFIFEMTKHSLALAEELVQLEGGVLASRDNTPKLLH